MPLQRFSRQTLRATPWKNGGGVTREVVCWPPGAGLEQFDWRVSIAHIASDGPFSRFAGVDRTIVLLEGPGVVLHSADGEHRLDTPLAPYAFAGDDAVSATRLGADCHDFNVMVRRSRWRARVTVLRGPHTLEPCPAAVLLAVSGRWQAGAEWLEPGDGLWWTDAPLAPTWNVVAAHPDAALLAVTLHPLPPP